MPKIERTPFETGDRVVAGQTRLRLAVVGARHRWSFIEATGRGASPAEVLGAIAWRLQHER